MKLLIFIVLLYVSGSIFSLSTKKFLLQSINPNVEKVIFSSNKSSLAINNLYKK